MNYWLMKSEPDVFSIDDLARSPRKTTFWDGVRNYQARGFMRDDMRVGDLAFFYYSNTEEPGIAGIVKVVKRGYPDYTAFDKRDKHYDPDSDPNESALVHGRRALRAQAARADHARDTARAQRRRAQRTRIAQARQPTFDHASERRALEIHLLARAVSTTQDRVLCVTRSRTRCATNHTLRAHCRDKDAQKTVTRWNF